NSSHNDNDSKSKFYSNNAYNEKIEKPKSSNLFRITKKVLPKSENNNFIFKHTEIPINNKENILNKSIVDKNFKENFKIFNQNLRKRNSHTPLINLEKKKEPQDYKQRLKVKSNNEGKKPNNKKTNEAMNKTTNTSF